ncbi:HAD-IB family hydrolase [Spiractinospora alimapuensis]|uniref:HAD-IB family hydrolase n=1 Tax=Spiractinospora alimapuensis TaxID=2820884 RepID=UPI001F358C50|nr:HAD-IB family hydrolase [Spiractinospora alimapuensis]QVQ51645.1 HAD-IB family hydrolase [Spiractinospora alimapuensis]
MITPRTPLSHGHVLLTGATGLLGQAVLERLLSGHPDCRVSLVIRPQGDRSAEERFHTLLGNPVFERWREKIGPEEADRLAAKQVTVLAGDLANPPELPSDIDTVIHCASAVKFDSRIDEAFDTNVGGAVGLYEALHRAGATPHVVHVSTAYVGGLRKGITPERSLVHDVNWREERDAAHAARRSAEHASRSGGVLRGLLARARSEHGKAGPLAVTRATEDARQEWVDRRLVEQGRLRAQSLGWTDVYTFTKALAERAAEELWQGRGQSLSVVRPTIIESALRHPYPGWIDGFKVADPLILAYGRGYLTDFPAVADSVLDIIPVDFVTNAILAAAQQPPTTGEGRYFHIGSGASQPLAFHQMYRHVYEFFSREPLHQNGEAIRVPKWHLDGDGRVNRSMRNRDALVATADWALSRIPLTTRSRGWADQVHKLQRDLGRLRKLIDLYRPYVQSEIVFDDTKARELHFSIPERDRLDLGFDVTEIDWRHYLQEIHIPTIVEMNRPAMERARPARKAPRPLTGRDDALAVFDLEGTLLDWNLVEQYLWLSRALTPPARWPREIGSLAFALPSYLRTERRDRGEFIRMFTRRYEGLTVDQIRAQVRGAFGRAVRRRLLPAAVEQAKAHRAAGHRVVLVTGSIDVLVEPLAPLFDEVVAGRMHQDDGVLTGYLDAPPLVDEARGAWLTQYADRHGMDLTQSYGYGDSHADVGWLQHVGHPTVVNPDSKLYRHARRQKWAVVHWDRNGAGGKASSGES